MKLFVVSDIHGSIKYASIAINLFHKSQADRLVILGDFYYHGPRNPLPEGYAPKDVCNLLNPLKDKIIAIKGNCDAEVDEYISEFSFHKEYSLTLDNGKKILFAHGHHEMDLTGYDAYVSGHTHIAVLRKEGSIILANPGSISLPKADNSRNFLTINEKGLVLTDILSEKKVEELDF